MAFDVSAESAVCTKCGMKYGRRKGFFYISYSSTYKGLGFMPVCKKCVNEQFKDYMKKSGNQKMAMRQMCRKYDLYWNDTVYEGVATRATEENIFPLYLSKINTVAHSGKCYDNTLDEEGTLWEFKIKPAKYSNANDGVPDESESVPEEVEEKEEDSKESIKNIPQEVIDFWGKGYSASMYRELEQRREYWMSRLPDDVEIDIGTEALIRQICNLEINIARDSAAGRPIEKSVNALNTLLGSLNLKPTQKKKDSDSTLETTPFGVLIKMREDHRPIGTGGEDDDGIVKYVLTWVYGHLSKMFNMKNSNTRLYEDAIDKYRVLHPEFDDEEDDDEFMYDVLSSANDESFGSQDGDDIGGNVL